MRIVLRKAGNNRINMIIDESLKKLEYNSCNKIEYLDKWVKINAPSKNEILVMFGMGFGMYIKHLLAEPICVGKIVILEPSFEIYEKASANDELSRLIDSDNVDIVIDSISDKFFNNYLYSKLSEKTIQKIKVAVYPNYHLLFPDAHKRFLEVVDEVWDMVSAANIVDNRFSDVIRSNIEINIPKLKESYSIADFASKVPKDIPVIIAASGPSLSKNILELKKAKGRSLIVGLDSSLPALLKEDVIPDLYVSIDPTKISKHFEDERIKDIPAVVVLQSPEHAIKKDQKYFFIFNGDEEILDILKEKQVNTVVVPPLGSVANTAFTLMNILGFHTIILVGQDLAYTDDKYHADNTVHNEKTFKQDTIIYLPGINGEEVKSSREFRMYKSGFEKIIEMFQANKFIDATEGGAYIDGTEVRKLTDVIEEYCVTEYDVKSYFDSVNFLIPSEQNIDKLYYINKIYELSEKLVKNGDSSIVEDIYKILMDNNLSESILYIFHQIKRLNFTNVINRTKEYYNLYEESYKYWHKQFTGLLTPLKKEDRKKNRVALITMNFLGKKHAPTRTALERVKVLIEGMGKEVIVINSKEELSQVGKIRFYQDVMPNSIDDYNGLNKINYENMTFKMYQPACDTPNFNEYGTLLTSIREYAPYEVIVIGDNCILGDLCADIIPTVCIPVVFSDIAYKPCRQEFVVITHDRIDSNIFDIRKMRKEQFLKGVFTFEMKPMKGIITREELHIPNEAFVISIVGIRLHHDITEEFLLALSKLFSKNVHLLFAGYFDNYDEYCNKIDGLAGHSTFVGYQNDMLAVQNVCDLYVNPVRLGGGYSIVEAFYMHKPGVTLDYGDVAINAGEDFTVSSLQEMVDTIQRYIEDKIFYELMSEKAYDRSKVLTDGKKALEDILMQMEESPLFF